ncbi:hypothetical protein M426DRAFT_187863 [Hypoxylon sp. CI-4A]|nr:hypothetical protein M426DRAFT_187863 [Hypoxylon sp. CI-4A]
MDMSVGSQADGEEVTAEPAVPKPPPSHGANRKKGTSCARCRRQKIRCDDIVPSCANCTRVGQVCIRTHLSNNADIISHINNTEARLRLLEDIVRRVAPEELTNLPATKNPTFNTADPYTNPQATTSQSRSANEYSIDLENPIDELESGAHNLRENHHDQLPSPSNRSTPSLSGSTRIGPHEPLAHEVGLLSLANSRESKYLGPSSGVQFARLVFSAIPQSQGLATTWVPSRGVASQARQQVQPFPLDWTSEVDLQHFIDAYFEALHPLHPFIDEDAISSRLEILYDKQSPFFSPHQMPDLSEIESTMSPMYSVQIFLIVALGARVLEMRLSADFSSERYLATAQARIESLRLPLHDTTEGLQIMLLLTLSGFYFENGPNAWFLSSNIIASCLDMGFQRRWIEAVPGMTPDEYKRVTTRKRIRSAIFWSAYSIERSLGVILGRPLTLRDEAIDVEFPGEESVAGNDRGDVSPVSGPKRPRIDGSQYAAAHYSFRFDRITAEIKLMLHRVVNLPEHFPWPTDLQRWQKEAHTRCDSLLNEAFAHLKSRTRRGSADVTIRSLELKYHHDLMLLYRPSPAIPRPTIDSWKICYSSAVKTIMIYSDLQRFSKLTNSWLTAHAVFISGITFIYCLWAQPQIKRETSLESFTRSATACTALLTFLGRTWSVASDAVEKFDRLVHMTIDSYQATTDAKASQALDPSGFGREISSHSTDVLTGSGDMGRSEATGGYVTSGDGNEHVFEPTTFYTELGDMSAWFDLDWILSMNTGPSGETISYPAL